MFHHLKLWVAVAKHNFKWVKIYISNVALVGFTNQLFLRDTGAAAIYTSLYDIAYKFFLYI